MFCKGTEWSAGGNKARSDKHKSCISGPNAADHQLCPIKSLHHTTHRFGKRLPMCQAVLFVLQASSAAEADHSGKTAAAAAAAAARPVCSTSPTLCCAARQSPDGVSAGCRGDGSGSTICSAPRTPPHPAAAGPRRSPAPSRLCSGGARVWRESRTCSTAEAAHPACGSACWWHVSTGAPSAGATALISGCTRSRQLSAAEAAHCSSACAIAAANSGFTWRFCRGGKIPATVGASDRRSHCGLACAAARHASDSSTQPGGRRVWWRCPRCLCGGQSGRRQQKGRRPSCRSEEATPPHPRASAEHSAGAWAAMAPLTGRCHHMYHWVRAAPGAECHSCQRLAGGCHVLPKLCYKHWVHACSSCQREQSPLLMRCQCCKLIKRSERTTSRPR